MSLGLDREHLCRGCPIKSSDTASLFTWAGFSKGILCVCPSVVVGTSVNGECGDPQVH